jgi:putative Mg2+ transporter-C (MgtC) family protein
MNFHSWLISIFDASFLLVIVKVTIAMLLGLILGLERVYAHKTAGMRTYALVSVASCFFTIISIALSTGMAIQFPGAFNVAYIPGSIIVGIGFLGAGLIIFKDGHIENLTTAAGLWVAAGIGLACGLALFREAIFATLLTLFVMGGLSFVERSIRLKYFPDPNFQKTIEKVKKPVRRKVVKNSVQ